MKKIVLACMTLLLSIGIASAKPKKQAVPQSSITEPAAKPATIVEAFGKLSQNLVAQANNKPTFAFMALNSDDGNALVENYVTDALTEAMFATGKIKVVERASLEKIMSEQQFQSSALVNENTAAEIGNLSGADFVCYGTLKDLKSHISVNVRVVEVSTAELYAMNRDTVEKDVYLANVGFEKRKESTPISGLAKSENPEPSGNQESTANAVANPVSAPAPKPKVVSAWTVHKKKNEMYTTYTFVLKSSSEIFAFMGYDKYNAPGNSTVRAGVHWVNKLDDIRGAYAIKGADGNAVNKEYSWAWWDNNVGYGHEWAKYGQEYSYGGWNNRDTNVEATYKRDGKDMFAFTYDKSESARFFVDLFGGDYFSMRHNDESVRFQTAGFWQTVEEQGLTREEIYNVISNDEF